jgi:general secretion pathway protein H
MPMLSVGNKKVSPLFWWWGESHSKVFFPDFFPNPFLLSVEKSSRCLFPLSIGKQNRSNGFTLLELLVVMVIIGMMAALVIPHLSSGQATFLNAQVREAVAKLRYASRSAKILGKETTTNFYEGSVETGEKSTAKVKPGDWVSRGALMQWAEEDNDDVNDDSNIGKTAYQFTFYPEGGSSGGELILSYLKKYKAKIKVNPITGKIESEILDDED